jgi:DNA processing protein
MRALLKAFGGPQAIYAAPSSALRQYLAEPVVRAIAAGIDEARIKPALNWLAQTGNQLLTLADADYPPRLLQISDPPLVLYLKGRRELLTQPMLAIVGSRNASAQGVRDAHAFARSLSDAGLTIASGLALGIDAAAHEGALAGRAGTVAVMGTGMDIIYPARNRPLALRIAEAGLIVSEFAPGTPSVASNFPRRNRIISGLSQGCLVIEATLQSGSLITARQALEQGREIFALPGSIHSPFSRGCHALIKQGAKLVESAQDVLDELNWAVQVDMEKTLVQDDAGDPIWNHLGHAPMTLDSLIECTGLTASTLSAMLLDRELAGQVATLPGGLYQRTR